MKQWKKSAIKLGFALFLVGFTFSKAQAQQAMVASGNNAVGDGGIANYSVGQMVQKYTSGSNGNAIQGIQFAFDNANLSIIDLQTNLEISTYPNPTTSILNLTIEGFKPDSLSYKLFNISGQLLTSGWINEKTTRIDVNRFPMATYILKINNNSNQTTKSFKIIKN